MTGPRWRGRRRANPRQVVLAAALTIPLAAAGCGASGVAPQTLEDMEFLALVDSDGDGMSFNDEPRPLRFSDYYASNRTGTRIIMLNAAAGWCAPCMIEASRLAELAEAYGPRGVVVLTAVFQDASAQPADRAFARLWAETFRLPIPTLIDSGFATGRYFDLTAMPANMFVDARNAEILSVATGAEPGADPLKPYRALLDHYLERP